MVNIVQTKQNLKFKNLFTKRRWWNKLSPTLTLFIACTYDKWMMRSIVRLALIYKPDQWKWPILCYLKFEKLEYHSQSSKYIIRKCRYGNETKI